MKSNVLSRRAAAVALILAMVQGMAAAPALAQAAASAVKPGKAKGATTSTTVNESAVPTKSPGVSLGNRAGQVNIPGKIGPCPRYDDKGMLVAACTDSGVVNNQPKAP